MQTYNITITPENPDEDEQIFQVTAEDIETLAGNLESIANYSQEIELELADGTLLEVSQHSEHGYNANLYANRQAFDSGNEPIGGGLCTGTPADAIEMALTNHT